MLQIGEIWQECLAKGAFSAKPAIEDGRVVWGRSTVLLAPAALNAGRKDGRLSALLAVASGVPPTDALLLLFETVASEWQRGERALAAIRLAFAPVPPLHEERAYRLFLAEQALDAGIDAATVLREFGLGEAAGLQKYNPNQPRVPAGSGRTSGQFAGDGATSAGPTEHGRSKVRTAFLDDGKIVVTAPPTAVPDVSDEKPHGLVLPHPPHPLFDPGPTIPGGLPLPGFAPPDAKTDEKDDDDGPACPAMRPDRPSSDNAAGQWEEFRLSLLVNPSLPTPKKTPASPNVISLAYYLPTGKGGQEVAIDDCKRSSEPSLIRNLKKGDMVEGKSEGSARLIMAPWASRAAANFDKQFNNQIAAIRLEGKGRSLVVCVGSEQSAAALRGRYSHKFYEEAAFDVCR